MPRKTRKQYKKKNKRGGMKTIKDMAENMKRKAGDMATNTKNQIDNAKERATKATSEAKGFFSRFIPFFGKKQPQKQMTPGPEPSEPSAPSGQMGQMGQTEQTGQMRQMRQQPEPTGGKRKSRRFIKKKGKVTLQGGRRIRSRKSKTRCRSRRRR